MIDRPDNLASLRRDLRRYPVVAILGPRQVGKTTLARELASTSTPAANYFDLEDPADLRRLDDESTALRDRKGLVVIDEVQRRPDLFPMLRVLADRPRKPARFLVLGSASPHLLRQTPETLAGRITFHELGGFSIGDVGSKHWRRLWLRGGFPLAFIDRGDTGSFEWRRDLIRTYLERDLPMLGFSLSGSTMERFWAMMAHYHGQVWNASELASSFGVAHTTVRRYLDILVDTFMMRTLQPWHENVGKRQVKAPKVYFRDSGLLHALLGVRTADDLERNPKLGASFEGFALDQVVRRLGADARDCYFWATYAGAELDLLVVHGAKRYGFEFKHTNAPGVTKSMQIAVQDLKLERLDVVHTGTDTYPLTKGIRAVAANRILDDIARL
ncbi:MAG TPA: ATP-binding protein [Planctomycetota bacterium]|nr:ATP-binding protein [Planctomycetota bacterium]